MIQKTNEPKRLPEYLEENELLSKRAVYTDLRGWKFSKIVIRSFTHYITLGVYQLKQGRFLHKGASQLLWIIWTFCTQGTIQHLKGWNTVKTCAKHNPSNRGLLLPHCKHLQLLKCQFQEKQFCNWISWWLILTWNIYRMILMEIFIFNWHVSYSINIVDEVNMINSLIFYFINRVWNVYNIKWYFDSNI